MKLRELIYLSHTASKGQSQELNPAPYDAESMHFTRSLYSRLERTVLINTYVYGGGSRKPRRERELSKR